MKALIVETILVLLISAGVQTTLYIQFAFAADSNSIIGANNNVVQPGYLLTVYVPSHPFGTSTVGISITTENGYTDQANIPTAGTHHIHLTYRKIRDIRYKCVLIQELCPTTIVVHIRLLVMICQYHYLQYHLM